jgi:hypothetical protein
MFPKEIPDELIDQLLAGYEGPEQITGPDGLLKQLTKRLVERAMSAELEGCQNPGSACKAAEFGKRSVGRDPIRGGE